MTPRIPVRLTGHHTGVVIPHTAAELARYWNRVDRQAAEQMSAPLEEEGDCECPADCRCDEVAA